MVEKGKLQQGFPSHFSIVVASDLRNAVHTEARKVPDSAGFPQALEDSRPVRSLQSFRAVYFQSESRGLKPDVHVRKPRITQKETKLKKNVGSFKGFFFVVVLCFGLVFVFLFETMYLKANCPVAWEQVFRSKIIDFYYLVG